MATFHEIETADAPHPESLEREFTELPPGVPLVFKAVLPFVLVVLVPYALHAGGVERIGGECPSCPPAWVCTEDAQCDSDVCTEGCCEAPPPGSDFEEPDDGCSGVGIPDWVVWLPEDGAPFSDHFRLDGGLPPKVPVVPQVAADDAGDTPLFDIGGAPAEPDPPAMADASTGTSDAGTADGSSTDSAATVDAGPSPAAKPPKPSKPKLRIPPAAYEGVVATIEAPQGAMRPFYEALTQTALKKGVTRIGHWGDSAIAADGMTHAARRLLQRQFGDAGHGFALVTADSEWYLHKDVKLSRAGWKAKKIISGKDRDGRYGYGGVAAWGYSGAKATFGTSDKGPVGGKVSKFLIHTRRAPKSGRLEITVDGEKLPEVDLNTDNDVDEDFVHTVAVPDGPHELRIRAVGGLARVYGVAMERDVPGVVYDSLGNVGARASRFLNADPAHWKGQMSLRKPDLMILMFGGNSLKDKVSNERYAKKFRAFVKLFRQARPEAACMVMSPLDHGERHRGRVRTMPRLLELMPVQKQVALEEGCAWFSAFDAMGGEGAMGTWVKNGWGSADYAHLTRAGGMVMGERFFKALMKGFADHLEGQSP